ncbi:MAG TPA: CRISPR-associated helicase Cas3' [Blastocatellia bacterium]|nr:CRISPR-associated helicase Cas3' [Blastocatellia bacterium]
MSFLAHTENEKGEPHLLSVHLQSVGALARAFAEAANPQLADAAQWAGLLHDLGKYRDEFQEYLRGKRESSAETHHAVYGAALARQKRWIAPSFAIAGHHAGLHDLVELEALIDKPVYQTKDHLRLLEARFNQELTTVATDLNEPRFDDKMRLEFYVRMVFSALVDADFLDTEAHYQSQRSTVPPLDATLTQELLLSLQRAKEAKAQAVRENNGAAELAALRNEIYDECLAKATLPQGFFSLTVPTGGGKTLSSMAFALRHAAQHNLRRVIAVIPYLSIIEQNAAEYRRILDPQDIGLVIENHSAVVIKSEDDEQRKTSEARARSPLVLAAENWDAPVVITTAVQFVESLFANKPSRCRKLHNVARSVVLLDEVQTLPAHLLDPLLSVMRELRDTYKVSFVFSSATQPAFRKQYNLANGFSEGEVTEITEKTQEMFKTLRRVRYELPPTGQTHSWQSLADEMSAAKQVLCVVNTRKQAFALWEALRGQLREEEEASIFHLSSAMCAEHRFDLIGAIQAPQEDSIRARLLRGLPCRVVSTQLVEAGVDLDFPTLYRALAPLDSLVQAAGRCNREGNLRNTQGESKLGHVIVFVPQDNVTPPGIYRIGTEHTQTMLEGATISAEHLATDPHIFAAYFQRLYQNANTGQQIQDERRAFNFRTVASAAKVISDNGIGVIVPYGRAIKLIDDLRKKQTPKGQPRFTRDDLRKLQRFIVNVRQDDYTKLERNGQLQPLLFNSKLELQVLNQGSYHSNLGVLVDQRPTEDYNQ